MTSGPEPMDLARLYQERFSDRDLAFKRRSWEVLCRKVMQAYVRPTDTVLDLGAGSCEFINAISAGTKIAVDLNPDVATFAESAKVVLAPCTDVGEVETGTVDVVFCSNLLEHLPDKATVLQTLNECHRMLRPGGTLMILQPNVRYLPGRYWDYFDHHTPLTHLSMVEALALASFEPQRIVPRFLPYTVKSSRIPRSTRMLEVYLRLPFLWPVFGRQMFLVARSVARP